MMLCLIIIDCFINDHLFVWKMIRFQLDLCAVDGERRLSKSSSHASPFAKYWLIGALSSLSQT